MEGIPDPPDCVIVAGFAGAGRGEREAGLVAVLAWRLAADPRPKLLALAQHDEYRDPAEVTEIAERWANADVLVVGGASHFFMGRTDRLVEVAGGFVDRLAPAPSA